MSQGLHVVEETASLCLCVCVCVYIGLGLANVRGGEQTRCTIGVRNVGPAGRIFNRGVYIIPCVCLVCFSLTVYVRY
jgi:hypothetical protein